MAQLSQIYFTTLVGTILIVVFSALFGLAVRKEWNSQLTPRAWSRPIKVIKNVLTDTICGVQIYSINWMIWALKLTYPMGLAGIPGTGTRSDGWAGPTLKMNLDGVILCKYHRMLFKVSVFATALCLFVLLPTYSTAKCDPRLLGYNTCTSLWNNTDFDNLTISAIPNKVWTPNNQTLYYTFENGTTVAIPPSDEGTQQRINTWVDGVSWRLMMCPLCAILIYIYICYLLWYEWIDNLALRRVYFLESDHYRSRVEELDEVTAMEGIPEDPFQASRPPFLPDPELRDTPPSIGLYSALYQLPESLVTYGTEGATRTERQLVATVNFFDECVPPQPGFSSSVAAVTIIPDASRVAKAWMKWYLVAAKVRRLRYVRKVLREKIEAEAMGTTGNSNIVMDTVENITQIVKDGAAGVTDIIFGASLKRTRSKSNDSNNSDEEMMAVNDPVQDGASSFAMAPLGDEDPLLSTIDAVHNEDHVLPTSMIENATAADGMTRLTSDTVECTTDMEKSDDASNGAKEGEKKGGGLNKLFGGIFGGGHKASNSLPTQDVVDIEVADDESALLVMEDDNKREMSDHMNYEGQPSTSEKTEPAAAAVGSNEERVGENLNDNADQKRFKYADFDVLEYARKLGFDEETTLVDIVDGLGIEELTVFAEECSLSSANPCLYGMAHEMLGFATIDELKELEEEAWQELREANEQLIAAREAVVAEDYETQNEVSMDLPVEDGLDHENSMVDLMVVSPLASERPGLRNRLLNASKETLQSKWEQAQNVALAMKLVRESDLRPHTHKTNKCTSLIPCFGSPMKALPKYYGQVQGVGKAFLTSLDHPTFAVVSFTSRQSAVAARQCLADGGATNTWRQIDDIPITPLADAPPMNILFCRGCCRPVTLTLTYKEKKIRRFLVYVFLFFFCCLYTIPLSLTSNLLNPDRLAARNPNSEILKDRNSLFYQFLAGISSGFLFTLFFSFLPNLFKAVAFYEGTSSSMERAERKALLFYWYFMLVTAFTGSALANMLLEWFTNDESSELGVRAALTTVAATIPTQQAPTWMNWIIVRCGFTLPGSYLLQMNTFLTKIFGLQWCNRVMRGGGPGSPTPYRLYVDSGVVLMCITSLAPVCPLIAPATLVYYGVCQPMLRWLLIFVFKPKYDGGGDKWPQLHQIILSSMILGQILIGFVLFLKGSNAGFLVSVLCTIPTLYFGHVVQERFGRSYKDAALLQTSRLDGWQDVHSKREREEYRRWLVDCHKASYVPVCLLGGKGSLLTSEPAVVIPLECDVDADDNEGDRRKLMQRQSAQKGAIFSRKFK